MPAANKIQTQNLTRRGRGRPKGSANKTTIAAKEAIQHAFDESGGAEALTEWVMASDDNRKVFYSQIFPKLLPLQVAGNLDVNAKITRLETVIVHAPVSNR